jgi:DNA uptake protein ComE-like DNA-binding protein
MTKVCRGFSFALPIVVAFVFCAPASAQLGRQQGLLEANTATPEQLAAIPGFTADLAKGLVERRPFLSMTDLNAYLSQSLNKDQLKEVFGRLFLHLNLNTVSRDELLLIPGMGNRMVREFEEYRPYKSFAQFRKEIGKYVDEKEVARLEQYVFIPVNLNTASDEDIQTIPGIGRRMLREFKEYRPYDNIEKFRKEIGKYVNAKEVARLERYVTLQ